MMNYYLLIHSREGGQSTTGFAFFFTSYLIHLIFPNQDTIQLQLKNKNKNKNIKLPPNVAHSIIKYTIKSYETKLKFPLSFSDKKPC